MKNIYKSTFALGFANMMQGRVEGRQFKGWKMGEYKPVKKQKHYNQIHNIKSAKKRVS